MIDFPIINFFVLKKKNNIFFYVFFFFFFNLQLEVYIFMFSIFIISCMYHNEQPKFGSMSDSLINKLLNG
jgi:hypothetical protein